MIKIDNKVYINCDACDIAIGPAYLTQDFIDIGALKICEQCDILLKRNNYLLVEDRPKNAVIILKDGSKVTVSKKDLKRFLKKLKY